MPRLYGKEAWLTSRASLPYTPTITGRRAVILLLVILPLLVGVSFVFYNNRLMASSPNQMASIGGITPNRLTATIRRGLTFHIGEQDFNIDEQTASSWFSKYFRSYSKRTEVRPDIKAINLFLAQLSPLVDRPARNARLSYIDNQLQESVKAESGQRLNNAESVRHILTGIKKGQREISLIVDSLPAAVSLAQMQQLKISKLIGVGQSDFKGSTKSRIHNINRGAGIFNGVVVLQGAEFSFDTILGPVDGTTGYLPELVIKTNKIVPEYGGGLCQVSTTLFRAAMASGLTILERHSHSMPVHYYNPQGYDATIYPGVADLRFKNDTPAPILIQSEVKGSQLTFEIYGVDDGRQVIIDGPTVYESQPDGSMKTLLKKTVIYSDSQKDVQSFYSSYKSPASFTVVKNPLE